MQPVSRASWNVRAAFPKDEAVVRSLLHACSNAPSRWTKEEIQRKHVVARLAVQQRVLGASFVAATSDSDSLHKYGKDDDVLEDVVGWKEDPTEMEHPSSSEAILGVFIGWLVARELQVMDVAVHPCFRRIGVAESLFRNVFEQTSNDWDQAVLEVRRNNVAAVRLYQKMGFCTVGERRNYYTDGEDALIMIKAGMQE